MINKNKINKELAMRLKTARKILGYRSASAFAIANDIPVQTYLNHESGKRGISIPIALEYCTVLGIAFNWLVTGLGEMLEQEHELVPE
jgi:DNA-binding XRE family transcriptional regulator